LPFFAQSTTLHYQSPASSYNDFRAMTDTTAAFRNSMIK
jgi:hypothetical protein